MQYSIAICSRPEVASDVISGGFVRLIVPDQALKLRDPLSPVLEKFEQKPSQATFSTVFRRNAIAFRTIGIG